MSGPVETLLALALVFAEHAQGCRSCREHIDAHPVPTGDESDDRGLCSEGQRLMVLGRSSSLPTAWGNA